MEQKTNKTTIFKRVIYFALSLVLMLGFCLFSFFPFTKNKVSAYTNFKEYDFVISVGTLQTPTQLVEGDVYYYFKNSHMPIYIGFIGTGTGVSASLIYPMSLTTDGTVDDYTTLYGTRSFQKTDSPSLTYIKYTANPNDYSATNVIYYSLGGSYNELLNTGLYVKSIAFNMPRIYSTNFTTLESFYNKVNSIAYRYYRNTSGDIICQIVLSSSYDRYTVVSNELFSIFINYGSKNLPFNLGTTNYVYELDIAKFDNISNDTVEDGGGLPEYGDGAITPIFTSVVNGISTFFNIEVLPDFPLSSVFLIAFGVMFMSFIVHLLIK